MNLSATQLETADLCTRKWRFTYLDRLPVYKKGHFGFGTCLHAVAERYLRSEANLYPAGWDIDPDSKVRLEPTEAALIPVLIQAGIDAGYLERRPGGVVEAAFNLAANGHILRGKIDYHTVQGRRIEDHKTAKNDRYIKKTGKALAKNIQMLIYAKVLLEEVRSRGEVDPAFITLVHNQFIIEGPAVRRTEGEVTTADVEAFWKDTVVPLIDRIVAAAAVKDTLSLEMPDASACNAFGGCPFMAICAEQESVLTYKARVSNMINQRPTAVPETTADMSSALDKLMKRTAPAAAAVNPPAPAASTAAPATVVNSATPASALPPWHSPKCPKCTPSGTNAKTPGFNSEDGGPCRICCSMSQVKARDLYEWGVESDGTVRWWAKGAKEQTISTTPPVAVEDKGSKAHYSIDALRRSLSEATTAEAVIALVDEANTALGDSPELALFLQAIDLKLEQLEQVETTVVEVAAPEPAPVDDTAEQAEEKKKRTRRTKAEMEAARAAEAAPAPAATEVVEPPAQQRQGFILMCNCTTLSRGYPGMTVVLAEELLAELPGYWNKNAFERRDGLQKLDWALRLGGCVVLASGRNPDVDALVAALKPIAALIVMGTTG